MSRRSHGAAAKSHRTASHPSHLACGHLPCLPRRRVAGLSRDRAGEGVLRPSRATPRYVVGRSEKPAIRVGFRQLATPARAEPAALAGATGRAAGVRQSSSATQGGTATGTLCKQDTETRGPPCQHGRPGQGEAELQPQLFGTPSGAGLQRRRVPGPSGRQHGRPGAAACGRESPGRHQGLEVSAVGQ